MIDYKEKFESERKHRHTYDKTARHHLVDEDDCCLLCHGSGYILYGNTSTFRAGIGGQTLTTDVCNKCWGSGSATKIWPSHLDNKRQKTDESRN